MDQEILSTEPKDFALRSKLFLSRSAEDEDWKNKSLLILVLSARTITATSFNISIYLWNPKQLSLYCNVLVLLYLAVLLENYAEMKNIIKSKYFQPRYILEVGLYISVVNNEFYGWLMLMKIELDYYRNDLHK